MIVVIEGMDASGKATQSKLLAEKLNGKRFSFPNYESETGKAILGHLKKEWCATGDGANPPLDALVFQCLQTVNRLECVEEIRAARLRGHVVFDRYWQSAFVYGSLDGLDKDWLMRVQRDPMPRPDVNILIDVPLEEGWKRRPERRDRYEADREFLARVRTEYLQLWMPSARLDTGSANYDFVVGFPGWYVVNGVGTVEQVEHWICEALRHWGW